MFVLKSNVTFFRFHEKILLQLRTFIRMQIHATLTKLLHDKNSEENVKVIMSAVSRESF